MAKAQYHNEILVAKEFEVLAQNKDGTVDIGTPKTADAEAQVVVRKAQVVKEPKAGCVILGEKPVEASAEAVQESQKPESKNRKTN